jgi:hypothetical protein
MRLYRIAGGTARTALQETKTVRTAMKAFVVLMTVLWSGAVWAQDSRPMVGGKPLVQVRPRGAAARAQPVVARLQACLDVDDGTKERLDCFDAVFPPQPKPKVPKTKASADCRYLKEQDERLACFNGFAQKLPKS